MAPVIRPIGFTLGVLLLGVASFIIGMVAGESTGSVFAGCFAVAAFLFGSQFLLSRGHVDAHRKDWSMMVVLATPLFLATLLVALLERPEVFLVQGVGLSVAACVGIYGGALAASFAARRAARRPL